MSTFTPRSPRCSRNSVSHRRHQQRALRTVAVVRDRVECALERLRRLQPGARLVLGTVYDPSDGTGDAPRVGLPAWPGVVDVIAELNWSLRQAAAAHDAAVAEIHAHFLGHGLTVGDPSQPAARPPNRKLWYCNIIEPNAWGAHGVRAAFWEALVHHNRPRSVS